MNLLKCLIILAAAFALAAQAGAVEPLELVQTIKLEGKAGNLDHLAVDAKGERLFVANKPNNSLDVIDLKSGKVIKQIPDQGKVSGVAFSEELNRVYVGNGTGTCNAFDGGSYQLVFSTKLAKADNVNYHAGKRLVYVAHGNTLSALDAKSGAVKAAIALPGDAHGFWIDEKGGKLFVSLTKPSQVGVIDLAKNELVEKFPFSLAAGNSPLAYDAEAGRILVGCRKEPLVVVLDAKTGKEMAGVAIPPGIDDLLFDRGSGRLYAIGNGAIAVIERRRDRYEVVAKVETAKSARTATLSPKGDRLYLGVPMQDEKTAPEVRVYAVKSAQPAP